MEGAAAVRPIITLTTDFGLADCYAAAMKGAVLSVNPQATLVDISHSVKPQQVEERCFLLGGAWPYFPDGSIHVAVVDPGVGLARRALILVTPLGFFVGPDNGVLSSALPDGIRPRGRRPKPVLLLPGYTAIVIGSSTYLRQPRSMTFHGRDVFAPVAGHLSLGVSPDSFGPRTSSMLALPAIRPLRRSDGSLEGRVIHVDCFGNLVTNVREADIGGSDVTVDIEGITIRGLMKAYGDGDDLIALIGSSGYLEVAMPLGRATEFLEADVGTPVTVKPVVVRLKRS